MNFAPLIITAGLVFATTEMFKAAIASMSGGHKPPPWMTQLFAMLSGVLFMGLLANSDFAHDVVIGTRPLDMLSNASVILVGLAGGSGALGWKSLTSAVKPVAIDTVVTDVTPGADVTTPAGPAPDFEPLAEYEPSVSDETPMGVTRPKTAKPRISAERASTQAARKKASKRS